MGRTVYSDVDHVVFLFPGTFSCGETQEKVATGLWNCCCVVAPVGCVHGCVHGVRGTVTHVFGPLDSGPTCNKTIRSNVWPMHVNIFPTSWPPHLRCTHAHPALSTEEQQGKTTATAAERSYVERSYVVHDTTHSTLFVGEVGARTSSNEVRELSALGGHNHPRSCHGRLASDMVVARHAEERRH